jgi:hypothetical protein
VRITYIGPSDAVEIPDPPLLAVRGEPVEVPDELAKRLLEQSCWTAASESKPAAAAKSAAQKKEEAV